MYRIVYRNIVMAQRANLRRATFFMCMRMNRGFKFKYFDIQSAEA